LKTDAEIQEADRGGLYPWTQTRKSNYVRVVPSDVTGRRFVFGPQPDRNETIA
jgi:hypothetical protein